MLSPDLRTLVLAQSLMLLQLAILVYVTGRRARDLFAGPSWWTVGLLGFAAGQFVFAMLDQRDHQPSIMLSHCSVLLGCAGMLLGFDDFTERPRRTRLVLRLCLAWTAAFALQIWFLPDPVVRVAMFSLMQVGFCALTLTGLRDRRPAQRHLGFMLMRGLAWSWGGFNVLRLVAVWFAPFDDPAGASPLQFAYFVMALFFGVWMALGCLLLMHERVTADLIHATSRDTLTGCLNRRGFANALRTESRRLARHWTPTSLLVADIDYLQSLNDRFGHNAGDRALIAFAKLVREELREFDAFARLRNGEFAVLLPGTDAAGLRAVAERLRRKVEDFVLHTSAGPSWFTVSIGAATLPDGEHDLDLLLRQHAETALGEAKATGRNRVIYAAAAVHG
ncbi:GGDEF domain-containing protein [Chitinimonas koreensis]|uniref:GGDEF domain-containing protein n=1 Tax=Chitinimonas koreensis TaxID=356302 RepID=UPI00041AE445|nr:GGDEF domain-containing protein [Chitinimonas koreensis]QNM95025.1 GGDEF domain-containing protein [Chitinimonas koreensis]